MEILEEKYEPAVCQNVCLVCAKDHHYHRPPTEGGRGGGEGQQRQVVEHGYV
jgi:hypothetical protein